MMSARFDGSFSERRFAVHLRAKWSCGNAADKLHKSHSINQNSKGAALHFVLFVFFFFLWLFQPRRFSLFLGARSLSSFANPLTRGGPHSAGCCTDNWTTFFYASTLTLAPKDLALVIFSANCVTGKKRTFLPFPLTITPTRTSWFHRTRNNTRYDDDDEDDVYRAKSQSFLMRVPGKRDGKNLFFQRRRRSHDFLARLSE